MAHSPRRPGSLLLILTVLLAAAPAAAQQPGQRVRLATAGVEGIFEVRSSDADSLLVQRNGGLYRINRSDLLSLEVSQGRHRRASTAAKYAGIGLVVGVLSFSVASHLNDPDDELAAAVYGGAGGLLGIGVGLVAGAATGEERWEQIVPPPPPAMRLGARITF